MSGSAPGPFTILGTAIADLNNWIGGPPKPPPPPMAPHELHTLWTCLSAGALTGCAYVPFFTAALTGKSPGALIAEFLHAPADPPTALVVWFGVVAVSGAYICVGLLNAAESGYAGLWAFWSAALPIAALLWIALHAPHLFVDPFVLGCLLVACSMAAMRFYLAIRGGSAMRAVQRSIRRKNRPLRPARTRRWWRLFF